MIGIPIKQTLGLNETQFGVLIAMPVLTGSLIRLPLGMWTDRFGGRIVFFILMLSTVVPIWMISLGTEFWHYLVTGLFVGVAGGSFTVGIAYCARWFPRNRQGLAMGIFGAGNTGAAATKLVAPMIVVGWGWTMVPRVYAVLMLITAIAFWFLTYSDPAHKVSKTITVREQLLALKDPSLALLPVLLDCFWRLCGHGAVDDKILHHRIRLQPADGGAAGRRIQHSGRHPARHRWPLFRQVRRPYRYLNWVSLLCLFFLLYPQTQLTIMTVGGPQTFHIGLNVWVFTTLMFTMGIVFAIGKASVSSTSPTIFRTTSASFWELSVLPAAWAASCCRLSSLPWSI